MSRIVISAAWLLLSANAYAAEVTVPPNSQPESLTVAPDGAIILGSANSPKIFRAKKGEGIAKVFVDVSRESAKETFLGVLADAHTNTLWACQIHDGIPGPGLKSSLRGFDLQTGTPRSRWDIPGATSLCNDIAIGADRSLYVTDTFTGIIWHVKAGGMSGDLLIQDHALIGVDGITFLKGELYVNNVFSNNLYRISLHKDGTAEPPAEIYWNRLTKSPDGMRADAKRMFVAENSGGSVSWMAVGGARSTITTLKTNLKTPTAVQPAGDVLWIAERGADRAISIPIPK